METLSGKCLCGAITFSFDKSKLDDPTACHCSQCRQWSGHYWASADLPLQALGIVDPAGQLKWFRASEFARRGFCGQCGSSLFWHADRLEDHKNSISVALGAVDAPTGISLTEHIFVADKGGYYKIADGLPQKQGY